MKRRLLFIVASDPRSSPRPAEAVRIAAGIAVWKQVDVAIYFQGDSAAALTDAAETLVDGDIFARCLPILRESGARVLSGKQTAQENELLQEVFQADSVLTF